MSIVAIMGNGPVNHLPNLETYEKEIDVWIGVDQGALILLEKGIAVTYAIGDFDSVNEQQKKIIADKVDHFEEHPAEKDATDLEIALRKAVDLQPDEIYFFGVTGGRLDHTFINIQLLLQPLAVDDNISGIVIDKWNRLALKKPGIYTVHQDKQYPYVSFVSFTEHVENLSLDGFYYPLTEHRLSWGSTLCISNELTAEKGTVSFTEGLLLFIQCKDAML